MISNTITGFLWLYFSSTCDCTWAGSLSNSFRLPGTWFLSLHMLSAVSFFSCVAKGTLAADSRFTFTELVFPDIPGEVNASKGYFVNQWGISHFIFVVTKGILCVRDGFFEYFGMLCSWPMLFYFLIFLKSQIFSPHSFNASFIKIKSKNFEKNCLEMLKPQHLSWSILVSP